MTTDHCCPRCQGELSDDKALAGHLKCVSCGKHVPLDVAAPDLTQYLLYTLSLPERTVRSTVALASGAAREAAELLVPRGFHNSKTYEVVVRNSLRFLTEDIGKTKPAEVAEAEAGMDDYLARKAVGNFVDLAALSMMHLSPMWMLAIVSDVAYGTQVYAKELATELKTQGLIDETSTIEQVDDILDAVRNASGQAAGLIDAPPLSVEELKKSLDETRAAISAANYTSIIPESEITSYWNEMREIAGRDNVSLLNVSTAVTMHSLDKAQSVATGTITGISVAGILFNDVVIGHYAESLKTMNEQGFYATVSQSYAPYIDAVWTNFSSNEATITEGVLDGSLIKRAYGTLSGWLRRGTPPADPSLPANPSLPVSADGLEA